MVVLSGNKGVYTQKFTCCFIWNDSWDLSTCGCHATMSVTSCVMIYFVCVYTLSWCYYSINRYAKSICGWIILRGRQFPVLNLIKIIINESLQISEDWMQYFCWWAPKCNGVGKSIWKWIWFLDWTWAVQSVIWDLLQVQCHLQIVEFLRWHIWYLLVSSAEVIVNYIAWHHLISTDCNFWKAVVFISVKTLWADIHQWDRYARRRDFSVSTTCTDIFHKFWYSIPAKWSNMQHCL